MKNVLSILVLVVTILTNAPAQTDTISIEAVNVEAYHVSRQLRSIPGGLSVLTASGLDVYDRTSLDALNTLPGITMQSGTYTTNRIIIRGMGSRTPYNTNRIRSYLNDIPITTSDGLSSPEEIDVLGIGRLEIVKGPSSALYGSGLGGNMNIFTPVITGNGFNAGIQYGSFNTMKPSVSASFVKGNSSLWSSVSHLHSDGYRDNSRYDRTSVLVTTTRKKEKWKFDLLLLFLNVYSGIPSSLGETLFENEPQSAAANWDAIDGYKKYTRGLAGFTLSGQLSASATNKLSVFGRAIDSYERRPFNNLDDHSVSAGIRNRLNVHKGNTDLVFGLEALTEQYAWKLDTSGWQINNNREIRSHLNLFGMIYYQPLPALNLSIAAAANYVHYRLKDRFGENGDQSGTRNFPLILSPRFGINYSLLSNWAVYASAGHGFSLPSPEETLLPAGDVNTEIEHESGWQAEFGSRFNSNNWFSVDATLYWIELSNLLVTKRLTEDIFTGINAGRTRHKGIEIQVHGKSRGTTRFPGVVVADLSYTHSVNRFISFTDDDISYDGKDLPGIPDHNLFIRLRWDLVKSVSLTGDIRYTGRQFLNDANTKEYESYILGNIKVNSAISSGSGKLELYAGINNLGNSGYASMLIVNATGFGGTEPRYFYPGLPRWFYLGMSYSF